MTLEELLRQGKSFGQGASNAAASTVTGPVDMLAWLLRKGGVPVGDTPIGGEAWMRQKGLMATPENRLAGLLGEGAGLAAPIVAAAKAPEIAGGLLQMGRNLAAPQTMNKQTGAIVYHGSPHKFDKFDSSKIGTGEGAQAYGHGLYLAESPKVALDYKQRLSKPDFSLMSDGSKISQQLQEKLQESYQYLSKRQPNVTRFDAIQDVAEQLPKNSPIYNEVKQALRYPPQEGGSLYKVDLPDEAIAHMLDWDKPLSQQPQSVQAAFGSVDPNGRINTGLAYERWRAQQGVDPVAASEKLKALGIPGVKYLDGGSRSAGAGSSNFVVFPGNEGLLKILERNGGKP